MGDGLGLIQCDKTKHRGLRHRGVAADMAIGARGGWGDLFHASYKPALAGRKPQPNPTALQGAVIKH